MLAKTILYDELNSTLSALNNSHYYLDAPIILDLLGTSGSERQIVFKQFIENLLKKGIHLHIFMHTYDELMHNLEGCLKWIDNPEYDANKASRSLNYFIFNGYRGVDIEGLIARVPSVLKKYKISKSEVPDYYSNKDYHIDEEKLTSSIQRVYKARDPYFDEFEKSYMIKNDVDSISAIHRLRRGIMPRNLEGARYIFITKNVTLAYATALFEKDEQDDFMIHSCVTDTFIGTILWVKSPALTEKINKKKLIANVYAASQPNGILIRRYLTEINNLYEAGTINRDEYYLLRSSRVARNLLNEKTLRDPNRFTDKTPEEILAAIRQNSLEAGEKKYKLEKTAHEETARERDTISARFKKQQKRNERIAGNLAGASVLLVYSILIAIVIYLTYNSIQNILWPENAWKPGLIISALIGLAGILFGINFLGTKENLKNSLYRVIIGVLSEEH